MGMYYRLLSYHLLFYIMPFCSGISYLYGYFADVCGAESLLEVWLTVICSDLLSDVLLTLPFISLARFGIFF